MPSLPLFNRPFVLAALAHLFFGVSMFLFLHLPGFLKELGAGEASIGRIMAAQAMAGMLCGPLVGRLLDVYGRRAVILAGTVVFTIGVALYLTITGIGPWVYVIRIIDGAGAVAVYAGLFTYASDHIAPSRRTQGLAIFGASGLLPMALSGQLGDMILARSSYHVLFLTSLAFASMVLVLVLPLRDAGHVGQSRDGSRGIVSALVQRDLMPVWFAAFAFFFAAVGPFTFMKTFVMTTGAGSVGGFFTAYASIAIALRVFFGWLPDRVGPTRVLGPALLSYAAGLTLLASTSGPGDVLAAGLLCGAGHGFAFPILLGLVVARVNESDRGTGMGVYTTIDFVGHMLGPPILGLAIEAGGYGSTYRGLAVFLVVSVVVFYAWDAMATSVSAEDGMQGEEAGDRPVA